VAMTGADRARTAIYRALTTTTTTTDPLVQLRLFEQACTEALEAFAADDRGVGSGSPAAAVDSPARRPVLLAA
jgi:hypothetical protein